MCPKPINIRHYTTEDEKAINECGKILGIKTKTRILLTAAHEYLRLQKSVEEIRQIINKSYEH